MAKNSAIITVIDIITEQKDVVPSQHPISIDPWFCSDRLSYLTLHMTLKKLEQDYGVLRIKNEPNDAPDGNANDYDPFDSRSNHEKHNYIIELDDEYDQKISEIIVQIEPARTLPEHIPHYVQIMLHAVKALNITDENQPIKDNIIDWLRTNYPELKKTETEYLATFVRSPERKKGGYHK